MNKKSHFDKISKNTGLAFGIVFFVVIVITTVFPFGIGLDKEAYIQSAIFVLYPIGLFIGLKWKKIGIIVCLIGITAYMTANFVSLPENFTFPIQFVAFWTILFLIQMIPVILYIISWYYHRQISDK